MERGAGWGGCGGTPRPRNGVSRGGAPTPSHPKAPTFWSCRPEWSHPEEPRQICWCGGARRRPGRCSRPWGGETGQVESHRLPQRRSGLKAAVTGSRAAGVATQHPPKAGKGGSQSHQGNKTSFSLLSGTFSLIKFPDPGNYSQGSVEGMVPKQPGIGIRRNFPSPGLFSCSFRPPGPSAAHRGHALPLTVLRKPGRPEATGKYLPKNVS